MYVQRGSGGWALFSHWVESGPALSRVRFTARGDGRLEVAEMHLEGRPSVTSEAYRNVPLTAMEAWANGRGREELIEAIEAAGDEIEQATDAWLTMIGYGKPSLILVADPEQPPHHSLRPPRSLRLRIPDGTKRPDSFYRRVAELYTALTASGTHRPAQMIAEANDMPVTTVRRWIKEARARDLLAPADRAGRAG